MRKALSECLVYFVYLRSFLTAVLQHVAQSFQVSSVSECSPAQGGIEKTRGGHSRVSVVPYF